MLALAFSKVKSGENSRWKISPLSDKKSLMKIK
jgi:hypothetical protein